MTLWLPHRHLIVPRMPLGVGRACILGGARPGARPVYLDEGTPLVLDTPLNGVAQQPTYPAVVNAGDRIFLAVCLRDNSGSPDISMHASMSGAGWSQVAKLIGAAITTRLSALFVYDADGTEDGAAIPGGVVPSVTDSAANIFYGITFRVSAANGFSNGPVDAQIYERATDTSFDAPAVTPASPSQNSLAIYFLHAFPASTNTSTAPTGATGGAWVEEYDDFSGVGNNASVQICRANIDGAISGGSGTHSVSASSHIISCALQPALV